MNRSTKVRYTIYQILLEVFKKKQSFDTVFSQKILEYYLNQKEITFVNNVCLNSMRLNMHCKLILKKFTKTKIRTKEFILLSSAIVQVVYLNIKPYAVVNETVNVSKKINVFPAFINAILKKVVNDINHLKNIRIKLIDFPEWFLDQIRITDNNLHYFIETYHKHPSLHLVFKSKKNLQNFNEPHTKTSSKSAFLEIQKKIKEIHNFNKGDWWVQDFASMIPIAINNNTKDNDIIDICAAPGGKSFQMLSTNKVILNDISKKRILRLKENLIRLNFNPEITNLNALNLNEEKKYKIVLVDSPCSSIGTIRRHPEILYRSKIPDFKKLNNLQSSLLQKASKLVKNKGKIIYMVCSFFKSETTSIIEKFLDENKNFVIKKYVPNKEFPEIDKLISTEGYFFTYPTTYKNHYIDGFFSAQLIKND